MSGVHERPPGRTARGKGERAGGGGGGREFGSVVIARIPDAAAATAAARSRVHASPFSLPFPPPPPLPARRCRDGTSLRGAKGLAGAAGGGGNTERNLLRRAARWPRLF